MDWFKKDPPAPPRLENDPWEAHIATHGISDADSFTYCLSECHRCRTEAEAYADEFTRIFALRFIKRCKNLKKRGKISKEWGEWIGKLNDAKL